jgi:hypothetical protein
MDDKQAYKKTMASKLRRYGGLNARILANNVEGFVKAFPELKDDFNEALKGVDRAKCTKCEMTKRLKPLVNSVLELAGPGRDLSGISKLPPMAKTVLEGKVPEISEEDIKLPLFMRDDAPEELAKIGKARMRKLDPVEDANVVEKAPPVDSKGLETEKPVPVSDSPSMGCRPGCMDCVRKHVAQAIVLLGESRLGYPEHRWLAIGHLAEASEEALGVDEGLAKRIRDARLGVMDGFDMDLTIFLK